MQQDEKNVIEVMNALQKIKDEVEFNLGTKKKQMTLDAYFVKELNWENRSCQEKNSLILWIVYVICFFFQLLIYISVGH